MLKIIIGGNDTAKSLAAARELVERAVQNPDKKFILIVPEQFSLQSQKTIVHLHPAKACMNIDIISFNRLAHVILAKLGRDDLTILDDTGKALVLKSVLDDLKDDLTVYGNKVHLPGFVEEVKSIITEFKQYGVDDNSLFLMQESAGERNDRLLSGKLGDMRLILARFNETIEDKYTTSEELLEILARILPESDFIKGADIYLDGFTGFTPVQYRLIEQMLKEADNVISTVMLPPSLYGQDVPEYDLFHLSSVTVQKLKERADMAGVRCEVEAVSDAGNGEGQIQAFTYAAASPEDEVTFTAGKILRLVRERDLRYRDIAVLTGDMDLYHRIIERVFAEAGIPVFVDHNAGIPGNVLVRFLLSALQMAEENMSFDSVFTFLKTGLSGLELDEINLLENYCLEFNIKGRNRWSQPFGANRKLYNADAFAWDLEWMNELREKFFRLLASFNLSEMRRTGPAAEKSEQLRRLMRNYGIEEKLKTMSDELKARGELSLSGQYLRIYELINDLLDKTDLLMGSRQISGREYSEMLESGINEIKVGIIPPALDMVMAGDLMRSRLAEVRAIFILGANDGKLPSSGNGSGIFTQKERELLKGTCEMAPTAREDELTQRFYIYQCINKPKELLYISWAGRSSAGEELKASWVVEDILKEACPGEISKASADTELMWKEQAVRRIAADLRQYVDKNHKRLAADGGEEMPQIRLDSDMEVLEFIAAEEPDALRRIIDGALFTNRQTPLDREAALLLYGERLQGSVSRFEKFYECPYRHFLNYGLRLEKRSEYEIKVTDLGTIYHEALERYSLKLQELDMSFRDIDDEESHRITQECVNEAVESLGNDIFDSSARNEFLKKRVSAITEKTTDILRMQVKAGRFEPAEYEMEFREDVSDDIRFKGKIDRVDIYDSEDVFVKIIDYKSGAKKFSIEDIYSGLQLQLVAYLDQAVKKYQQMNPERNVKPAGVYYYLINDKYSKASEKKSSEHMLSGLTSTEGDVFAAVDTSLENGGNSDIVNVSYNKDGSLSARSQVAGNDEFFSMMEFVNNRVKEAGSRIRDGEIDIEPYRSGSSEGCKYCDYKDICRFEAGHFGTDWKEAPELDKKEMQDVIFGHDEENG